MLKIRCSVALVSLVFVAGLVLVPAPSAAWSGWGGDLSIEGWVATWSQWFGGPAPATIMSKGGAVLDPDGAPEGEGEGNAPVNDPPAANAVQLDAPELATSGGD